MTTEVKAKESSIAPGDDRLIQERKRKPNRLRESTELADTRRLFHDVSKRHTARRLYMPP